MSWIGIGILIGIGIMVAPLVLVVAFAGLYLTLFIALLAIPVAIGAAVGFFIAGSAGADPQAAMLIGALVGCLCSVALLVVFSKSESPAKYRMLQDERDTLLAPSREFVVALRKARQVNAVLVIALVFASLLGATATATSVGDWGELIAVAIIIFFGGLPLIIVKMYFDPDIEKEQMRLRQEAEARRAHQSEFFRG